MAPTTVPGPCLTLGPYYHELAATHPKGIAMTIRGDRRTSMRTRTKVQVARLPPPSRQFFSSTLIHSGTEPRDGCPTGVSDCSISTTHLRKPEHSDKKRHAAADRPHGTRQKEVAPSSAPSCAPSRAPAPGPEPRHRLRLNEPSPPWWVDSTKTILPHNQGRPPPAPPPTAMGAAGGPTH